MKESRKKTAKSLLVGALTLMLSLVLFLHFSARSYREHEVEIELVIVSERLFPELCEVLCEEEILSLDGRFPLEVISCRQTSSLLRFYDGEGGYEFTVPSKKYSDYEITLRTKAREHPFGYALFGVRTVNVGMGVTLLGSRCKIYGTISSLTAHNVKT